MNRFMSLILILLAFGSISCGDHRRPGASATLTGPTVAGKSPTVAGRLPTVAGKLATLADDTRDGATDQGDITNLGKVQFLKDTLNGNDDAVDYYKFTVTADRAVAMGLRQLDYNADLFLEDDDGTVLGRSENGGTANEWLDKIVQAGTYYVRVQAQETGDNAYVLRYGVTIPVVDADATSDGAEDLGDVTDLSEARFPIDTLNGYDDRVDYYKFTLTEAKEVAAGAAATRLQRRPVPRRPSRHSAGQQRKRWYGQRVDRQDGAGWYLLRARACAGNRRECLRVSLRCGATGHRRGKTA